MLRSGFYIKWVKLTIYLSTYVTSMSHFFVLHMYGVLEAQITVAQSTF